MNETILMCFLAERLEKIGGWPNNCVAISLSARGFVWCHSKMPVRFSQFMGVWTDCSFWGNTTSGFFHPLYKTKMKGCEEIRPVTKDEYDGFISGGDSA